MQVLTAMDLPTKAIVDLDYAMKNGISEGYLQPNDSDITACLAELATIATANNITIGPDGWPFKSGSSVTAAEGFAILAQSPNSKQNIENICTKMQAHNIWVWKNGTIEKHLNLTGKNEAVWANFCDNLDITNLQTMLPNEYQEIENCINWLLN